MKRLPQAFRLNNLLVLLVFCIGSEAAFAHKVNLFAYAEGDQIYVEGYFVDGKKTLNSRVDVYAPDGQLLLQGETDEEGIFTFPVPQKSDLKIVLSAGMGHQTEFLLPAAEISETQPAPSKVEAAMGIAQTTESINHEDTSVTADSTASSDIDQAVERAVNKAIKPLIRELNIAQQKAKLSEIVSAIGYILGLAGLFVLVKSRKSSQE